LLSIIALLATSFVGVAQEPGKMPRVGYARSGTFDNDPYREPFVRGMREHGWIAGRNIAFEFRNYGDDYGAVASVMNDLLRSKVDVIVVGGTPAVRAAQAATRTVPIVMGAINDPIGSGFIQSLARPGGNITGMALLSPELTAKRLELFKEIIPHASRIAILKNPDNFGHSPILKEVELAAHSLGFALLILEARRSEDFNPAFAAMRQWPTDGVIALDDAAFIAGRVELAAQAIRHRLPLVCGFRELAQAGCLFTYAVRVADMWHRSASYVDKILKGAKPADLPVEQPTKIELVVNLRTAKALGLEIPATLLACADEVIE
jgi:putative tryptophan/tyrosine transport system substrate-binding protein